MIISSERDRVVKISVIIKVIRSGPATLRLRGWPITSKPFLGVRLARLNSETSL
jgi:hypothetical protein